MLLIDSDSACFIWCTTIRLAISCYTHTYIYTHTRFGFFFKKWTSIHYYQRFHANFNHRQLWFSSFFFKMNFHKYQLFRCSPKYQGLDAKFSPSSKWTILEQGLIWVWFLKIGHCRIWWLIMISMIFHLTMASVKYPPFLSKPHILCRGFCLEKSGPGGFQNSRASDYFAQG